MELQLANQVQQVLHNKGKLYISINKLFSEIYNWGYRRKTKEFDIYCNEETVKDIVEIYRGIECIFLLTKENKIYFIGEISYKGNKVCMSSKTPIELKHNNLKSEEIR
mgnify:CR=1 FL=1